MLPLGESDHALVLEWLQERSHQARVWAPAWVLLIAIPAGVLLIVAAGFLMDPPVFHALMLGWVLLFPVACLYGLVLEWIWPVRPWTRFFMGGSFLLGALGLVFNAWRPGAGDWLLWPLVLNGFLGSALFVLKVGDRAKAVRPSKVRRDLTAGELWIFQAEDSPELRLLPRSGLALSLGDRRFPSLTPMPIQMAAATPRHRWEIPAYGLAPLVPELQLSQRRMEPSEVEEGERVLKRYRRDGIKAYLLLGILSLVLLLVVITDWEGGASPSLEYVARLSVSGFFWCIVLAGILDRRKRIRQMGQDLRASSLIVVRDLRAASDALPFREILPASRVVWSQNGRLGPLRRKYPRTLRLD